VLATAILEIAQTRSKDPAPAKSKAVNSQVFYNLVNPLEFTWLDLLSQLRIAGLEFTTVPFQQWLDGLRESVARGEEQHNPAGKLVDYYEQTYGGQGLKGRQIKFDVDAAKRDSEAIRQSCDVIGTGLIKKFLKAWQEKW
jgi:hypothetical protein